MRYHRLRQVHQAYLRASLISNNQQSNKTNKRLELFRLTNQQLWAPSTASQCKRFYNHSSRTSGHWKYSRVNSCLNLRPSVSKRCKLRWSKPWQSYSTRSVKCLWSSKLCSPALRPRWANRRRSKDLQLSSIHQRKNWMVIWESSYHKLFRPIWLTKKHLS